jgi:hypothetical protein
MKVDDANEKIEQFQTVILKCVYLLVFCQCFIHIVDLSIHACLHTCSWAKTDIAIQ